MNYQALYRKYRPRVFDDVKGQDVIVRTLRNQVKTGRIAHAYLFCGSRGTGKTTCAKILAQAVNCLHPVNGDPCMECESCKSIQRGSSINVIEMDAASRNGVDDFRRIIEEVAYPPTDGGKKVYIIDEVHMLSTAAFNAFLKTLEEPPEYAVFILATTDPQKLLPTVLSRCQRFDFRRIPVSVIEERLREVFAAEGIEAEDEAIRSIARRAEGGMRDALSIADRCVSFFPGEKLTGKHILEVLGTAETSVWREMLRHAVNGNASAVIRQFDDMLMDGKDVGQIVSDFTWYLRDLLIFMASGGSSETDNLVEEDREVLMQDAEQVDERQLMYYIEVLSGLSMALRNAANRRVLAEISLINLCRPESGGDLPNALDARVSRIENLLENGQIYQGMGRAGQVSAGTVGYAAARHEGAGTGNLSARDGAQIQAGTDIQAGSGIQAGTGIQAGSGIQAGTGIQPGTAGEQSGQDAKTGSGAQNGPDALPELPHVVVPELFQRIASQWEQTMSLVPDRGRGEILARFGEVSFSKDEPDTLFISLADNWYISLGVDKELMKSVSDAIAGKYGVQPRIRFVNSSQGLNSGLTKIKSTVEALNREGIDFPIDVE